MLDVLLYKRRLDVLLYEEGWMHCIQRRMDELLYDEGWMNCYTKKVGWTVI